MTWQIILTDLDPLLSRRLHPPVDVLVVDRISWIPHESVRLIWIHKYLEWLTALLRIITSAEHQRNTEKHTVKSDTHDCSGSVWRADSVCGSSASISGCFSWFSSSYKHFTPSTPSSFHRHTVKHPPTHTHTFRRMTSQVWERVCGISEVRQLE